MSLKKMFTRISKRQKARALWCVVCLSASVLGCTYCVGALARLTVLDIAPVYLVSCALWSELSCKFSLLVCLMVRAVVLICPFSCAFL